MIPLWVIIRIRYQLRLIISRSTIGLIVTTNLESYIVSKIIKFLSEKTNSWNVDFAIKLLFGKLLLIVMWSLRIWRWCRKRKVLNARLMNTPRAYLVLETLNAINWELITKWSDSVVDKKDARSSLDDVETIWIELSCHAKSS